MLSTSRVPLIFKYRACLAVLEGCTSLVSLIQLLPSTILTADANRFLRRWSKKTYDEIWTVKAHATNAVTAMKCSGSRVVTGGSDGNVKWWDLENGSLVKALASSDAVWQVGFVGDGVMALFSRNGEVV
jgi:F-box and WD-40 domain protein CDC4